MTLAEMLTSMGDRLGDPSHVTWLVALKTALLNEANKRIVAALYEQGIWRMPTTTITTQAGIQEYNLPADFYLGRSLTDPDGYDIPIFDDAKPGPTDNTGEPTEAYIYGSYEKNNAVIAYAKIGFKPIPEGALIYTLRYNPTPFTLVQTTDVSVLPEAFHDLPVLEAGARALKDKGMWELARDWDRDRKERWAELMEFATSRQRGRSMPFRDVFGAASDE
jgi:hypothetical protein